MRRMIAGFVIAVVGLGGLLGSQVWLQQRVLSGPAGGSGVIEGASVRLSSRVGGRITELTAAEGARVSAGEVLLRLDCVEARAGLAEATARVAAAREQAAAAEAAADAADAAAGAAHASAMAADAQARAVSVQGAAADRQAGRLDAVTADVSLSMRDQARASAEGLQAQADAAAAVRQAGAAQARAASGQAGAARSQAEAARLQADAAEAALERAVLAVDECEVRAPRDGLVQLLPWEEGELVGPGAVLAIVVDLSEPTASFYLPNADLAAAQPGGRAEVRADAWPDRVFSGRVATVSSEAEFTPRNIQTRTDRDRLVYRVEVEVENPDGALRPGMPVEVQLVEAP
jgi:HlyD family secretion protein